VEEAPPPPPRRQWSGPPGEYFYGGSIHPHRRYTYDPRRTPPPPEVLDYQGPADPDGYGVDDGYLAEDMCEVRRYRRRGRMIEEVVCGN
jgi:hypothetical protein